MATYIIICKEKIMLKNLMPTIKTADDQTFMVTELGLKIGSMSNICDIVINESNVSPIQCEIIKTDEGWAVHELHSDIGISVNGNNVPKGNTMILNNGDWITVGSQILTFNERTTVFTEDELNSINQVMSQLSRGENVDSKIARDAVALLIDRADELAVACGIEPKTANENVQEAEANVSNKVVASEQVESKIENKSNKGTLDSRKISIKNDQIVKKNTHPAEEAFYFNEKVNDAHMPTLCFLTPTDDTANRYRSRAICVKHVPYNIGADLRNDYVVTDGHRVSDVHAQIVENSSGGFAVKNKDSRYGTYVNGQLLQPEDVKAIHAGDIVRFGKHSFKVEDF